MLALVFERVFEKTTLVMSLDDFYLTRAAREELAERVHPMLRVRGVPGTHDVELLRRVIDDLKARRNTEVPVFDKGEDDRDAMVPVMGKELDLLILEGWCWGALPQPESELEEPVNELEARLDPLGSWRRHVNQQLALGGYQEAFEQADVLFYLAVPDMDTVRQWRWEQEERLSEQGGSRVMDQDEVDEFTMYFERLTRRMLKDLPLKATLTLYLDERHQLVRPPRNMN
jgi:D-glycerate 3-kinase